MSKLNKIEKFNPNDIADSNENIYGLPFDCENAALVIIPVPWDVTVSYCAGTASGPDAIKKASLQVDLFDPFVNDAWKIGIAMDNINKKIKLRNKGLRKKAVKYLDSYAKGNTLETDASMREIKNEINKGCGKLNKWVKEKSLKYLEKNKLVVILGGDHSTPLGLIQALAEKNDSFAILHFDAHADLREAYEGFEFSHASVMNNVLKIPQIKQLVQVGIRDYCEEEKALINSDKRITAFFDRDIKHQQYEGRNWSEICEGIIKILPEKVYISMDIDGLDPKLCPNTGTPVPGGFELEQLLLLIEKLVVSKRKIIGFDINEVAPGKDEWDANVAARLLFRLANLCVVSNR